MNLNPSEGPIPHAVKLSNGVLMPRVGLGTWQNRGPSVKDAVISAVKDSSYTHIDTAIVYRNHVDIGAALREIGVDRKSLFITRFVISCVCLCVKIAPILKTVLVECYASKLPPVMQGYETCMRAFDQALADLQMDYLDCFLIHWPGVAKTKLSSEKNLEKRKESWRAMEELYQEGRVRSIGVR